MGSMATQGDIEDKEPIDIRVQIVDELERHSPKMATRLEVQDTSGNTFPFTVWNNNALSDYAWEEGQWYELEHALGNLYQGRRGLNGSYQLAATPIEPPTEQADEANRSATELNDVTDGLPYLSLFPVDHSFESVTVYKYQIEADGAFDEDAMTATYNLAAYLRRQTSAAVTHTGPLSIVSTSTLTTALPDVFSLTSEQETELQADKEADRPTLERLLKQLVKRAVASSQFHTDNINRIRTREAAIEDDEGLFEACHAYSLRLELLPSGKAFVGVEISLHARSQATLDEYLDRTNTEPGALIGTHVEHDPDKYDVSGTATFQGYSEHRFTDPLPDLGKQSLADWYEHKSRVPGETLNRLRELNPRLVELQYNPNEDETRVHVPQLLRVAPRKEVVRRLAPGFHRRWDRAAKLFPDERFTMAREFVAELDVLPEIDAAVEPDPVGPSLEFQTTKVDRADDLLFGDGRTADVPSNGLRYGVYSPPESFHVQYLVPERYLDMFDGFHDELADALARINCSPDDTTVSTYELGSSLDYTTAVAGIDTDAVDAVLAVVPDPSNEFVRDGTIDDPYGEFKKAFAKQAVPTQMVVADNLTDDWVHRNTALGLVAGAGGVPWIVDEMPGDVDCFIGLDATRDPETGQFLGASANVVRADGTVFLSKSQSLQSGETFDEEAILDVVKDVYSEFITRTEEPPSHIVIHRDGRLFEDVDEILAPFESVDVDIDIVDIRKSGAPRIAFREDGAYRIDEKGRLFIAKHDDVGFLSTTGRPEFDEGAGLGTPQTLRVVRRAGDTDMQTLMEQVYWLSESHVGSAQRSTRLPITTYYADRCAEHAREGYLLQGELIRGVPYL